MRRATIYIGCIIAWLTLLAQPAWAQNNDRKRTAPGLFATKGTLKYYEDEVNALFKKGRWEEGKKLLDEGFRHYEQAAGLNRLMGTYWIHYNKPDRARYYLIRALRDDNKDQLTLHMLMKIEEKAQHYSSAIVYCNQLLELSPYDYELWRKKIELFRLQGNHVEASRMLLRLGSIYPDRAEVRREIIGDYEMQYRRLREKNNLAGQEEVLRELVRLSPKDEEFQLALCNVLIQSGRLEEALDIAGHAATVVANPYPFVEKKASLLAEMARFGEALAYVQNVQNSIYALGASRGRLNNLKNELEKEQARANAKNDPYTAYGRLYEQEHSEEALTYLLNTSMTRGYLDDALMYIREARRLRGDTQNLMYREYIVQRRMGNTRAAIAMLQRMHERWPDNTEVNEELCALQLEEVRRMMDLEQWDEATSLLEQLATYQLEGETKDAVERRLFTCYVSAGEHQKALQQLDRLSVSQQMSAELYEEIMIPHIKMLMSRGLTRRADEEIQQVIDRGYPSADILTMGINTALILKNNEKARSLVEQGKSLYPDDPFFLLKDAQLMASEGNYQSAYDLLQPMLDTYLGDSALVDAYVSCCEELAATFTKGADYESAMRLIDAGLEYDPSNQSLMLAKSLVHEKQKDWEQAIATYKQYHPPYGELREYHQRMESLKRHLLKNRVTVDYQWARPSNEDNITSMATMSYSRIQKNDTYTVNMVYVGRDGLTDPTGITYEGENVTFEETVEDEVLEGGNGIQVVGEWEHKWNKRFTSTLSAGISTKFLPRLKFGLGGSYSFDHDWTGRGDLSFRQIGDDVKTSLWGAGLGVTKDLAPFSLGADVRAFYMKSKDTSLFDSKFFVNGSLTARVYPVENSRSHIFVTGGVGNAPEISLIDKTMPLRFNQLNTMLGCGGLYVINSMIDLGISATWYNMAVSSRTQVEVELENATDPMKKLVEVGKSRNYLYLDAYVTIHF